MTATTGNNNSRVWSKLLLGLVLLVVSGIFTPAEAQLALPPYLEGDGVTTAAMAAEKVRAPIATLRDVREILLRSANSCNATQGLPGLNHPSIPMESRVLTVCEEFVRRTAGNGRDAKVRRQALEAIRKRAGQKRDPDVVAALSRLVEVGDVR